MYFPTKRLILLVLLSGLFASAADAEEVVFLVRHAEKAAGGGSDPDLSTAGRLRAKRLREALKDGRVARIFVTEFKRTQQTAAPVAQLLQLVPKIVPATDSAGLLTGIRGTVGNVLVVGHSNTIPDVIAGLGISAPIQIAETDFDNLFILIRKPAPPRLIRLHYH